MEYLPSQGSEVPYRSSSRDPRECRRRYRIILGRRILVPFLQPGLAPSPEVPYPCRYAASYPWRPVRVSQVPRYQPPSPRKLPFPGGEGCSTYRRGAPPATVQYRYLIHAVRKECICIPTCIVMHVRTRKRILLYRYGYTRRLISTCW